MCEDELLVCMRFGTSFNMTSHAWEWTLAMAVKNLWNLGSN